MPDEGETERHQASDLAKTVGERLFKHRTILISGDINQKLAREVSGQLVAMDTENHEPITLFINSQGGHVESGDTIHDMIRAVRSRVRIVGTGWVASAGALIYVAPPLEDRYCLPNTRFLLHQPSGGFMGKPVEMEIEVYQVLAMKDRLNRIIARQTGQTVERVEHDTRRNFWLDAQAAKEYGLVGHIIEKVSELE